jgi:hypothetical protein
MILSAKDRASPLWSTTHPTLHFCHVIQHIATSTLQALTATATVRVREDICANLFRPRRDTPSPFHCINSFHRPNLRFAMVHSKTSSGRTILQDLAPLLHLDANHANFPSTQLNASRSTLQGMWQGRQNVEKSVKGTSMAACPICSKMLVVQDQESSDSVVSRYSILILITHIECTLYPIKDPCLNAF